MDDITFTLTLTARQLWALQGMLDTYCELQREVHNHPPDETLFTQTQRDLFDAIYALSSEAEQ
jgi:hypothetical protein